VRKIEGNLRQVSGLGLFSAGGPDVEAYIEQDRLACGVWDGEGFERKLGAYLATENTEKDSADFGSGVLCALCGIRGEYLELNPMEFGE